MTQDFMTIYLHYSEERWVWVAQIDPLALSCSSSTSIGALDLAREMIEGLKRAKS